MCKLVRDLRYARFNSDLAKKVLGLFYRQDRIYRIALGPLRGIRLRYDPSINYHAMLGLWELQSFEVLAKLFSSPDILPADAIVCDVGANIGLYSLWFARHLSGTGRVYAFEPAPNMTERLRDHVALSDATNIDVIPLACSNLVGKAEFYLGFHHHTSSLFQEQAGGEQRTEGRVTVDATTLDHFFYGQEMRRGPDIIKMDIEGGGALALQGCDRCVEDRRPLFLIESHMPEEDRAISQLVLRNHYHAYRLNDRRWVENRDTTYPDPAGVWGDLLLCPSEKRRLLDTALSGR